MKITYAGLIMLFLLAGCSNVSKKSAGGELFHAEEMAGRWEFVGEAINEPGYDIWGSSPIKGEDGKIHLFCSRWPGTIPFKQAWRSTSEIAHYVSDSPEGPFRFVEVVASHENRGGGWNKEGFHNPNIRKIGNTYVLVYIANDGAPVHGSNQRIGMMIADHISGPWKSVPDEHQPLLSPPQNDSIWCYQSGIGVNNPSLLEHPDGRFFLYFKAMTGPRPEGKVKMGVAISTKLAGPYIISPNPVTANERAIEDGYAFVSDNKICLLTTDNHGILEKGGGLLWISEDGLTFNPQPLSGFHHFGNYYLKGQIPKNSMPHYNTAVKFERPQLLMDERGDPAYLYCPSGVAIDGSDGTNCYVLKYESQ